MLDGGRNVEKKMPRPIRAYVRVMDTVGYGVGLFAMLLTFGLMGLLVESSFARLVFGTSHIWSVEMAQFVMAAYYLLGGALSEQDDYHVRMDLLYARLSTRKKAIVDCFTTPLVIFYMAFMFLGGIGSSRWALFHKQVNYSPWAPPMSPIKIIMTIGLGLMLLQLIALWFRALATALGRSMGDEKPALAAPPAGTPVRAEATSQ